MALSPYLVTATVTSALVNLQYPLKIVNRQDVTIFRVVGLASWLTHGYELPYSEMANCNAMAVVTNSHRTLDFSI